MCLFTKIFRPLRTCPELSVTQIGKIRKALRMTGKLYCFLRAWKILGPILRKYMKDIYTTRGTSKFLKDLCLKTDKILGVLMKHRGNLILIKIKTIRIHLNL